MTTVSAIELGRPAVRRQSLWRYWRGGLQGSEFTWAVAFLVPYIAVFLAFVVYPVVYGLWMGSDPSSVCRAVLRPDLSAAPWSTPLIFLAFGVNVKLFLALMLSGFFMRPGWWVEGAADGLRPALGGAGVADLHLDPLDAERRVGACSTTRCTSCSGSTARPGSIRAGSRSARRSSPMSGNGLPFWTVILLAGRMSIPQEIYDAAKVDGATGLRRFVHVTFPLLANLYLVLTLLATIFLLGDFNSVYFRHRRRAGATRRICWRRSASATPSTSANPQLGVAAVMSALPLLIPLVIILMRKLKTSEVQL